MTPQHRWSLTALAASTALSFTPLLAQTTEPAPPVIDAPAAPAISAPAPTQNPTPAASMAAIGEPVLHVATEAAAPSAARPARAARPAARTVAQSTAPAAPRAVAPTAVAASIARVPAVRAAPGTASVAPVIAARTDVRRNSVTSGSDHTAEILGGGLALLALGGGAFAVARRKRREDDALEDAAGETVYSPAPLAAVPAQHSAPAGDTRLPSGFDLSRFSAHTQAAYRGPTDDNPSLSLRTRLRRASFFDQRAREADGAESFATTPVAVRAPIARRVGREDQIVVRPAPVRAGHFRQQAAWQK